MQTPDFEKYSLALIKDNEVVYSSEKSGLRPVFECVSACKGKFNNCILHDKVMGLAAARVVVYSGMISEVITLVASRLAKDLLEKNNIKLTACNIVENILTKDKSRICPGELKAQQITDNRDFFMHLNGIYSNK